MVRHMNDVLTSSEAAALLQVSLRTIKAMARERRIPARKAGRSWRFSRKALEEWLEGDRPRRVVTTTTVEE